eukprot:jgi/Botrbrau1/12214/Bobra.0197s0008.1
MPSTQGLVHLQYCKWFCHSGPVLQTCWGSQHVRKVVREVVHSKSTAMHALRIRRAIGLIGYAAFGNDAPGNMLTGFGFYEPYWLVDIANVAVFIHLLGAYQPSSYPVLGTHQDSGRQMCSFLYKIPSTAVFIHLRSASNEEGWVYSIVPNTGAGRWIHWDKRIRLPLLGIYHFSLFRLVWRTLYVCATTVVAMLFPFFNDILGLLGAIGFWPMHKVQKGVKRFSWYWWWLESIDVLCLLISLAAGIGSVEGLIVDLEDYHPFHTNYK